MTRSIIHFFFVELDFLNHLEVNNKTLRESLVDIGLRHLLTLREPIYPSLVKYFYSNIILSSTIGNKIFTKG